MTETIILLSALQIFILCICSYWICLDNGETCSKVGENSKRNKENSRSRYAYRPEHVLRCYSVIFGFAVSTVQSLIPLLKDGNDGQSLIKQLHDTNDRFQYVLPLMNEFMNEFPPADEVDMVKVSTLKFICS